MCKTVISVTCDCGNGPGLATRVASTAAAVVLLASTTAAAFGPAAVVVGVAVTATLLAVAIRPLRRASWWVLRNAVAPLLLLLAVTTGWYFAGGAFTARARERRKACGATYRRAGGKLATGTRTNVHWYAWPGWQRTVLRVLIVAIIAAAYAAPIATAAALAAAGAAVLGRAALLRWQATHPRTVQAIVGPPAARDEALRAVPIALTASSDVVDAELLDEPARTRTAVTA